MVEFMDSDCWIGTDMYAFFSSFFCVVIEQKEEVEKAAVVSALQEAL